MSSIPKPTKKDVENFKKEASDKFQDRMNKMTDLRKKRENSKSLEEKEQLTN